ncbi:MAG: bifunctional hydroxymethylpyrimidine kinase/phosphomethylpyrimidine kinase [Maricaulis sp.]|jgi:hydroxymethylpyrimidine/phosphomethylpyrimidine kinase|nr:bifunctional hydroxymethylpyrimidine kinase/phosphomethylpyrimidine kinase [Maricaulis sp.]HAQ36063.1 bifunctional hydroxymethylpyrimidine kinase/phosphomethylpyrimidine kinase [Alphaproteobacteria bacterium]
MLGGSHRGRVLIVAGSDSGGGAGIQADIKAVSAAGGYAATAITALTVQNTLGVSAIHPVPLDIIEGQMRAVLEDIGADAIKTGMLATSGVVSRVARVLKQAAAGIPLVLDPVMVATSGDVLLEEDAIAAVLDELLPLATLLTPNAPEAARLTGLPVTNPGEQAAAGRALVEAGARAVLVKGGHLTGPVVHDVLVTAREMRVFETPRLDTRNTHGTGCTLASAIAARLAQGMELPQAIEGAGRYLHEAIARAPGFGSGKGPVDHVWTLREALR